MDWDRAAAVRLGLKEASPSVTKWRADGQPFLCSASSFWPLAALSIWLALWSLPLLHGLFWCQALCWNCKVSTCQKFYLLVWRLATGPFVHENFINLLFSVISYIPSAMQEENNMGTVPFALRFFKLSLFINVLFCLVSILIGFAAFPSLLKTPAMGLWPILMCDLVIQCYQYPEMPRGLCCLPVQIKSKWYPLVLIALFSIFFGP
jgi:membrane associated rhomboid family serine protease